MERKMRYQELDADTDPGVTLPHKMVRGRRYKKADPAYFFVYQLEDAGGLVYVGITQNPGGRFAQHMNEGRYLGHNVDLSHKLKGEVAMTLLAYLPSKEARALESKMIRENLNKVVNKTLLR